MWWTLLHTLSTSILGPDEDAMPLNLVLGGRLCHSSWVSVGILGILATAVPISAIHIHMGAFSIPIRQVYSLSVLRVRSHKGICRAVFLYVYVSVGGEGAVSGKSLALSLTAPKVAIFLHR